MNRIRKLACALVSMALCLGLLLPQPALAADLYFTSINDNLLPLTSDTMPVWSGGVLYVPYSVFDSGVTGINLGGLICSYNRNGGTAVTLFNLKQMLVFDLVSGTCRNDVTGETYPAKAIIRNGRPYLPVATVCDFFGLSYSYNTISQGYLVRIKSGGVVLSDVKFIDAAGDLINRRLREYSQSLTPSTDGANPVTPVPVPDEDGDSSSASVRTYLAFRCQDGEGVDDILDALDSAGRYGLFLFTPQALAEHSNLVRRALGTGHSVGVLAEGADREETGLLLEQGRVLLERACLLRVTTACVPPEQRDAFEAEGWVCWDETMALAPSESVGPNTFASNTLRRLSGRAYATYLTLPGDANTGRILPSLLRQLEERHFLVSVPMETRL